MIAEPWNKGRRYRVRELRQGGHEVGEEIGPGVLSEYVGRNQYGHHLWMWRCACGTVGGPTTLSHLRRGTRCASCMAGETHPSWRGCGELTGRYLGQIRADAAKRGLLFEVTPEELWEKWEAQEGRCAYTGLVLTHGLDASLDRRDNAYGYVPGNVQWVHRDVNRMKSDLREDYFVALCRSVVVGFDTATPAILADFVAGRV